ncbi:CMGC protein kinase [Aspergillus uvarum CBS 121591]|uniref:CMGC protein kinase n=1 Tax=Aspergillus uvarum CBS 121591 TaxID=1448315 RepID=A0A319CDF1_9EURO|nr:CMGC protein kinase [Aspergillus uvarum CBS 121591]PYH76633.1 CMGC protein kinase [Aspergillus uvarum CBS 121591]
MASLRWPANPLSTCTRLHKTTRITQLCTRNLSILRRKPLIIPHSLNPLSRDEPVEEEKSPGYRSEDYYPAKPGEVLADRYQLITKLGWGMASTVWLARDMTGYRWQQETVVALKIGNTNCDAEEHELALEGHIPQSDATREGRIFLRTALESFIFESKASRHLCLVYEPMRESLRDFRYRFVDAQIPLVLIKLYIRMLLLGLDYLHSVCRLVHTDLKLDNIMMSFEDPVVLDGFTTLQFQVPMEYKIDSAGRHVYLCHNEFGPLRKARNIPKIVDFGSAIKLNPDAKCIWPIQPHHYRAPEVILGCGWNTGADIWNMGVLLWNLLQGRNLYTQVYDVHGYYSAKSHLAEMIALFGPPPPEMLARAREMRNQTWSPKIRMTGCNGKLSDTAEDLFDGPFFDEEGEFLYPDLIPERKLVDTLPVLEGKDKEMFLDLARNMLVWDPTERLTAAELAEHPALQDN